MLQTAQQIQAEIHSHFGFFPPFFAPALPTPAVLLNLWQQTQVAYLQNPLPSLFKEKVAALLARHCSVPYCLICHSSSLGGLGLQAQDILTLLEQEPIHPEDLSQRLDALPKSAHGTWPAPGSYDERTLLHCCYAVFAQDGSLAYHEPLRGYLGVHNYNNLIMFIAYNRTALAWAEAYPELPWAQDQRVRAHLGSLVATEPRLALYLAGAAAAASAANHPFDGRAEPAALADPKGLFKSRHASAQHNVFLQAILDCTAHGIWGLDMTGNLTFINHQALELFGYESSTNLIGQNPHTLFHHSYPNGDPYPVEACPIFASLHTGCDVHLEHEVFWRADGTSFVGEYRSKPIVVHGTNTGTVVSVLDVTEQVKSSRALKRQTQELADAVAHLNQEQNFRDSFVATLTHDLRTPIASAKMVTQLLQRRLKSDAGANKSCARVVADMNRANRMIENLLDATRIKAGDGVVLNLEPGKIDALVAGVVADANAQYGERFILKNQAGDLEANCDALALQRVLENLLTNAHKYGAKDTPITTQLAATDGWVDIRVHNAGNPIPTADQRTLFDPYHRTESAQASGQKGWGLGLTLVKGITLAHGGEVAVHSAAGVGTTFVVRLPIDSCAQA